MVDAEFYPRRDRFTFEVCCAVSRSEDKALHSVARSFTTSTLRLGLNRGSELAASLDCKSGNIQIGPFAPRGTAFFRAGFFSGHMVMVQIYRNERRPEERLGVSSCTSSSGPCSAPEWTCAV